MTGRNALAGSPERQVEVAKVGPVPARAACSEATPTGGPVRMPVTILLIRALLSFYLYYGDDF